MEEAGLEALRDSVIVAVSTMDEAKMFPAEELKSKEPEAGELENCHSALYDDLPHGMALNHCGLWHLEFNSLRPMKLVTHTIADIMWSMLKSLELTSCRPIHVDIKPSNVLLKDSGPKQVNLSSFSDFPPGFRFYPSDEELICGYLRRKTITHSMYYLEKELVPSTFLDFDDNAWSLPDICRIPKKCTFFNFRERKYRTTLHTFLVQNAMGKHRDDYSKLRLMGIRKAKLGMDYMNSGILPSFDPIFASYETSAMDKKEKHQTGVPVENKKKDILRYSADCIPEVWKQQNARAAILHAEVLLLEELSKLLEHHCWRKVTPTVDYNNSGSPSVDIMYASNGMKTKGERLFYIQSYKDAIGKVSNWTLNIFQRGCRKSSELQKVWPQKNKIVSWSSASYLLLLIFSLFATSIMLSAQNFHTNQLIHELEVDFVRPAGSLYDQPPEKEYTSWNFSSFSIFLFPATLLMTILLLELNLESRMSSESYVTDCGTDNAAGGSGLRGYKQKHSQLRDAGITKGIVVSQTTASYALLLVALLSAVISLLVALNFQGSISDGSYPGSFNLYKSWFFISINSTVFFTSVAVMVILMHELSLGTWLLMSTLSMLGSYACLVVKVVPLHGMPLLLLGIPSTVLARVLRNAAPA